MNTKEAMEQITQAVKDDPDYAWSWHCNVAMAAYDEGLDWESSQKAAQRFMDWCFQHHCEYAVIPPEPPSNAASGSASS